MAHTFSTQEYQELGRAYYKKKEYQKAIEAFTNGIESAVIPTVTLYDYRAATYEKLADFNAAVRDGREAIRLNKKDVKGYLRTGSALQKLNKLDTAVNIYKYGMKNVPLNNKDFQLLQQLHDKLTRKLSPAKAIDPFTVLPVELVEMILGYLPFKNVVNCLRVSRGWKRYLIKRPGLWVDLDLSGASKAVSRPFIRNAVRWSENAVTRLTVHRFQHTDVLRNIATACKFLHTLEIISLPIMLSDTLIEVAQCAFNLKKLVLHTEVSLDTVSQIMRHRPTLEHVEFRCASSNGGNVDWGGPFHSLQSVTLKGKPRSVPGHHIMNLLDRAKNLQSLAVVNWGYLTPSNEDANPFSQTTLTSLVLKEVGLDVFPLLPSTLKRFSLQPLKPMPLPRTPDPANPLNSNDAIRSWVNATRSHLPFLEHLSLREMLDLSSEFLEALLDIYVEEDGEFKQVESAQCLKSIELSGQSTTLFGPNGLLRSPRILTPSLTTLNVPTLPCTDDDIEVLLTHPTSIQSVDISYTKISGASLKMLADGLPNLGYLKADECRHISSRDAVEYAERKGITVSCKMNDSFGSGKKVRYG